MRLGKPHLEGEIAALHPRAREALDELDAWCRERGLAELYVSEVRADDDWAKAGCAWAVRLRCYSRPQRNELRNRLASGRRAPGWEVVEEGDRLRCVVRDFPWRKKRLGY